MHALTFLVRFQTAQFKEHMQKLTRRTYLIPPPSAIAGIFGSILGIPRRDFPSFSKGLLAGAELRKPIGRLLTMARIYKVDRDVSGLLRLLKEYYNGEDRKKRDKILEELQALLPIKESEELYMAEYKFAVASRDETIIEEGLRRIETLDFEYEVFGGNDYHFVDYIGNQRRASVKRSRLGRGYCRLKDFEGLDFEGLVAGNFRISYDVSNAQGSAVPLVIPATFLANVNEQYVFVYGKDIRTNREIEVVDDAESKVFVYKADPFVVSWEHVE